MQRQDGDVLAGLEDVPWGTLHHAYGSADDVVHDIRALVASDIQEREAALERLHSTIWHQGTVYEASRSTTRSRSPYEVVLNTKTA